MTIDMRADYDSEARSIQIWLKEVDRHDGDVELLDGNVIVSLVNEEAALVDVQWVDHGLEKPLRAAADEYDLDYEALLAAAEAALAAPDRSVTLSVTGRIPVAEI